MYEQYSDVHLIRTDDLGYRRHLARYARRYREMRRWPVSGPSEHSLLGKMVERGVRSLYGERRTLSDRRVLSYLKKSGTMAPERQYREIDGVVLTEDVDAPILFVEIKSCVDPKRTMKNASQQIGEQRRIVSNVSWGDRVMYALALVVPDGLEFTSFSVESEGYALVDGLDGLVALGWDRSTVAVALIRRAAPWARAVERGWVEDTDLLRRVLQIESGGAALGEAESPRVHAVSEESAFAKVLQAAIKGA